jgi:hypothetical protein
MPAEHSVTWVTRAQINGRDGTVLRRRRSGQGIKDSHAEGDVTSERRRIKHTATFEQRLANEAERIKTEAKELPQGKEREDMMRKARQAETASQISAWLFLPGLQKPT